MALPVPLVVNDHSVVARTKFQANGMGFAQFVATWPTNAPPDPPDVANSGAANDPWRYGDASAVTHILYRVIENRTDPAVNVLPDDVRDAILADIVQRSDWAQQGTTDFWYRDLVDGVTTAERGAGRHTVLMPTAGWDIDATVKCYWVVAWLGLDADNIIAGYDTTP